MSILKRFIYLTRFFKYRKRFNHCKLEEKNARALLAYSVIQLVVAVSNIFINQMDFNITKNFVGNETNPT